jgi:thiamine-phosphate diphosphorylase
VHIVTNEAVLARPDFLRVATALLAEGAARVALHVRGARTPALTRWSFTVALAEVAKQTGSLVVVNDRVDIALAGGAGGVHLGERSVGTARARKLVHPPMSIGRSVHSIEDARNADEGTDYLFLGTIQVSPSHHGERPLGLDVLAAAVATVRVPILAIGGITPGTIRDVLATGAWGGALISAIWDAADPVAALRQGVLATAAVAEP